MSKESHSDPFDIPVWAVTAIYVAGSVLTFGVYLVLKKFWGEMMLVSFDELEGLPGTSILEGLGKAWFIFLWGAAATLFIGYLCRDRVREHEPGEVFGKGLWLSLNAGIFEELNFRWLWFVIAMVTLPFLNFITFGLVEWFYVNVSIPVANFATLGALEPQLLGHSEWVFGAAIVLASVKFRDAHQHLGFLGWVNSWFLGMVMFWLVFNYSIWTAMVAHVLYDVVVFTALAISMSWQPRRGFLSYSRQWR